MAVYSDVSPATLPVDVDEEGVHVTYLDGRRVTYRASPKQRVETVDVPAWSHVHLLIVDADQSHGRMVYINDRHTDDEILESTGVGRVILAEERVAALGSGIDVKQVGERIHATVSTPVDHRLVFVFVEDQFQEHAYEVIPPTD